MLFVSLVLSVAVVIMLLEDATLLVGTWQTWAIYFSLDICGWIRWSYSDQFCPGWHQFHQYFYAIFFSPKRQKAACFWKLISPCFFVQKLCWLCHSQVTLSCAGCLLRVTIRWLHKKMKLTFGERTQDLFALNFSYSSITGFLIELDTSLSFCSRHAASKSVAEHDLSSNKPVTAIGT